MNIHLTRIFYFRRFTKRIYSFVALCPPYVVFVLKHIVKVVSLPNTLRSSASKANLLVPNFSVVYLPVITA